MFSMEYTKKIEPDDLEVGMKVTVLRGQPIKQVKTTLAGKTLKSPYKYDQSYQGDILTVEAISFPYAVFSRREPRPENDIKLDLRKWDIGELSEEYINYLESLNE